MRGKRGKGVGKRPSRAQPRKASTVATKPTKPPVSVTDPNIDDDSVEFVSEHVDLLDSTDEGGPAQDDTGPDLSELTVPPPPLERCFS